MTDTPNLPAVPEAPRAAADTDSWALVMRPLLNLAETVHTTDFVPTGLRGNMPATAAAMLYGREVGLPPMTALNMISVIEGKPGLSAEGMRALVLAAGHGFEVVESTGAMCHVRGRRRDGSTWTSVVWTLDMARAAGLAGRNVWGKYPRAMLLARATTELCRSIFPDVIHGFRSLEELGDMSDDETPGTAPTEPQAPRTRVGRKRAASRAPAQPAAVEGPRPDAAMTGPPLPGEDGFEDVGDPGGTPTDGPGGPSDTAEGVPAVQGHDDTGTPDATETPDPADASPSSPESGDPKGEGAAEGEAVTTPSPGGRKRSAAQHRMIMSMMGGLGIDVGDRDERLFLTGQLIGHEIATSADLLHHEAATLIDTLATFVDEKGKPSRPKLDAFLDALGKDEPEAVAQEALELDRPDA